MLLLLGIALKSGIGRSLIYEFLLKGYSVGGIDNIDFKFEEDDVVVVEGERFENNERNLLTSSLLINTSTRNSNLRELLLTNFIFSKADIRDENEISNALQVIFNKFQHNKVSALINNAAISSPKMTATTSEEILQQWRNYIDINLSGAFIVSHLTIPYMIENSSIIHISSTRARQSEPFCEGYAASKAGLIGLTHSQAASLSQRRIRVNCILPGFIDTGNYPITEEDKDWHYVGRVGKPQDISELCLFLCDSSKSGFITGQEFVVDGGVSTKMVYP